MRILIIGGKGTIGNKVSAHFAINNEVLIAGRSSGEATVDISDSTSITLTTGILADDPVVKTTSAAMVNGYVRSVQGKDRGTVIRIYA